MPISIAFVTSIALATSTSGIASASVAIPTPQETAMSSPQAPPAAYTGDSNDGWSPAAIIGIVAAIVTLLISIPLIAVLLRRYERKRLRETVKDSGSSRLGSSEGSIREGQSLRSILVTRELQRTSVKLSVGLDKPEQAHLNGREWSRTEVRGGHWK